MNEKKLNEARLKYDLADSDAFEHIRKKQLEMILEFSLTAIEPLELKGMARLVAKTGNWKKDYEKKLQQKKNEEKL